MYLRLVSNKLLPYFSMTLFHIVQLHLYLKGSYTVAANKMYYYKIKTIYIKKLSQAP